MALCCAATFALKLWANEARVTAGHGDTAYYFHVAQNLFAGRGFVCDYVWSFLENPTGVVPAPSHAWWMPGPSILAWLGMVTAGQATYAAAKVAMALVTSVYPAVVWLTARRCCSDRTIAFRATLLSVAFHPFIDQPSAPISHGPYGILVATALALLAGGPLDVRRGAMLGALVGLAHYFRGDALTLFGTAGILGILHARRAGWRAAAKPLAIAVATYVAVMAPWFARNLQVFGRPLPEGPSKALFLRDYYDWFALPDRLTPERYFFEGVGVPLADKAKQTAKSLWSLYASYFDPTLPDVPGGPVDALASLVRWFGDPRTGPHGGVPPPWLFLRHLSLAMAPLTFVGLGLLFARARRQGASTRWAGVASLHALAEIAFYAWLFTGVANQSYVSSLYSLYPLFVVGIAASLDPLRAAGAGAARGAAVSSALGWALTALLALGNAAGVSAYLRIYKGPEYGKTQESYAAFGKRLRESGFDPKRDRLMIQNTWNLYAADPLPIVRLPDEPIQRVLMAARRAGVTWIAIPDEPDPATKRSITRPFRLSLWEALRDGDNFWIAFRDDRLKLTALRLRQRGVALPPATKPASSSAPSRPESPKR